jgi:hypothetical protein
MLSFKQFIAEQHHREGEQYFDTSAIDTAKNPPPYDMNARRPGFNPDYDKVIHMHPQHFLSVARNGDDENKTRKVKSLLDSNTKFSDLPELHFTHNGYGDARVSGHEGRHRARALLEKGVTSIPVVLRQRYNGDVPPLKFNQHFEGEFPIVLHGEKGSDKETSLHANNSIPFPVKDHRV